jgi:hypothetical protein
MNWHHIDAKGVRRNIMKNRIISLVMALALVLTLLPVYAIADAADTETDPDMAVGETVDIQSIIDTLKSLIGSGNIDLDQLKELLGDLDTDALKEVIKGLLDSDVDLKDLLSKLDTDTLTKMLESLFGDDESLKDVLSQLDIEKIADIIKGLIDSDKDIGDILDNLSTDQLVELFKQFINDNETLKKLLENLDSDQIAEIIKKLFEGGYDISGILKNLDAYTMLKVLAEILGSELDVTGPADVTVGEGETAVFNVKVNTAGTYKYMWLEPDTVAALDLSGIDFSGSSMLEIATKVYNALKSVALSTSDTLSIENTSSDDNGRTFVCAIYVFSLSSPVLYITDEASLTVTAAAPHQHTVVIDTPAVAATCTKNGCTEGSHCSTCNAVISKSEVVKATGHNYVLKVCTKCGDEIPFPFTDVPANAWCRSDVEYVWKHDIMNGISETKFGPGMKMTRAMFVTVLYRLEGSPSVEGMPVPAYSDLHDAGDWSYNAIVWAYNAGVTNGTSDTTFSPNAAISREEIVTMLYRYSGSPAVSGAADFNDFASVASWARNAVIWASANGVVKGYPDGSFGPDNTALRSEMAAMLHRYMENNK